MKPSRVKLTACIHASEKTIILIIITIYSPKYCTILRKTLHAMSTEKLKKLFEGLETPAGCKTLMMSRREKQNNKIHQVLRTKYFVSSTSKYHVRPLAYKRGNGRWLCASNLHAERHPACGRARCVRVCSGSSCTQDCRKL